MSASLDPSVTVGVGDDLEGDVGDVVLDLCVLELATDQTLGGEQGVLRVDRRLSLGGLTDQTLTVLGEGDDTGCRASALGRLDDLAYTGLVDGRARVGCSKIDTACQLVSLQWRRTQ